MMKRERQNDKKPIFSFGQIMIPLVGLVAIGLLYLGVKMFFFAPVKTISNQAGAPDIVAQPAPSVSGESAKTPTVAAPSVPIEEPSLDSKNVIAVPSTESPARSAEKVTKGEVAGAQAPQPSVKVSQPSEGGWGVQVGSFTEKWRADEVKKKLESAGYANRVRIIEATVNGKLYYRVQVYAGTETSDAKELEKKLKDMDLPTLVVKY